MGSKVSGTLQGFTFHALGFLWNAAVTQLLYATCPSIQTNLSLKLDYSSVINDIRCACDVFKAYEAAVPFARTFNQKITALLESILSGPNSPTNARQNAPKSPALDSLDLSDTGWVLTDFDLDCLNAPGSLPGQSDQIWTYPERPYDQDFLWGSNQDSF